MNKKLWFINTIGIFLLCFPCHFVYDFFPNPVTAIFFPVNESIFEHVKMLFTACMIFSVIEYFWLRFKKISLHNFFLSIVSTSISNLVLLLLIYLPVYYTMGEKMIVTIVILFVSILLSQWFFRFIVEDKIMKTVNVVSACLIPIFFFLFGYLTYRPIKADLFYDPMEEKYGLSTLKADFPFYKNSVDFLKITML